MGQKINAFDTLDKLMLSGHLVVSKCSIVANTIAFFLLGILFAVEADASRGVACPDIDGEIVVEPESPSTVFHDLEGATRIPTLREKYDHIDMTYDEFYRQQALAGIHCIDFEAMAKKAEFFFTTQFNVIHLSQDERNAIENLVASGMQCSNRYAIYRSSLDYFQCHFSTPNPPPRTRSRCDFGFIPLTWRITLGFEDRSLREAHFSLSPTERCDVYEK